MPFGLPISTNPSPSIPPVGSGTIVPDTLHLVHYCTVSDGLHLLHITWYTVCGTKSIKYDAHCTWFSTVPYAAGLAAAAGESERGTSCVTAPSRPLSDPHLTPPLSITDPHLTPGPCEGLGNHFHYLIPTSSHTIILFFLAHVNMYNY